MVAADDIIQKINELITKANSTTGKSSTTLKQAVDSLIERYGQSGDLVSDLVAGIIGKTITEIVNADVTSIGLYAFYGCLNLTRVSLENAGSMSGYAFYGCSQLKEVNLPKVENVGSYAFRDCSSLEELDLPKVTTIANYAFYGCSSLKRLVLRANELCVYNNSNSSYDPKNSDFKIYVPGALLESYKTATNWSRMAGKFLALEGSGYE